MAPNDSKTHQSVSENSTTTRSRLINAPVAAAANSTNCNNPHHAFPIATARTTRLPPWEDFQRGPHSALAETKHSGPHRKSFTKADIGRHCGEGRLSVSSLPLELGIIVVNLEGATKNTSRFSKTLRPDNAF